MRPRIKRQPCPRLLQSFYGSRIQQDRSLSQVQLVRETYCLRNFHLSIMNPQAFPAFLTKDDSQAHSVRCTVLAAPQLSVKSKSPIRGWSCISAHPTCSFLSVSIPLGILLIPGSQGPHPGLNYKVSLQPPHVKRIPIHYAI